MPRLATSLMTVGLLASVVVHGGSITIFNSGVDNSSKILPAATVDPHYVLIASPDPRFPGSGVPVTASNPESWLANDLTSNWIAPTAESPQSFGYAIGTYVYTTTFDLTGFDPATARLTGRLSADDHVSMFLNGISFGLISDDGGWTTWHSFSIDAGFVNGVNTLTFEVLNVGGPTGLRVEATGTADAVKRRNPAISQNGVLNAAGNQPLIAQNTWVSIYGTNLAHSERAWGKDGDFAGNKLPTQLDGVSVTVNNKAAYVGFVKSNQINFLVPIDSSQGPVQVQVTNDGVTSDPMSVQMQQVSPAFFTFDGQHVAATHADNLPVAANGAFTGSRPASPGEVIVLWATGFGQTERHIPDGQLVTSSDVVSSPVRVVIGSIEAKVEFQGLTGAGLYQLNVVVPDELPDGDIPIVADIQGLKTQDKVFITVQR